MEIRYPEYHQVKCYSGTSMHLQTFLLTLRSTNTRALSRAVEDGGVGTTSMDQSRCGSLDGTRVRQ